MRTYYQQFEEQQTQSLIDQRIKEHLGQAATYQQVGAAFNQHLMSLRPPFPVLPMVYAKVEPRPDMYVDTLLKVCIDDEDRLAREIRCDNG